MPIRPHLKYLYPIDWPQLSALIRFERAKGRCEGCGRPHGMTVRHLGDGSRKALAFLHLASIRLMLRRLCQTTQ